MMQITRTQGPIQTQQQRTQTRAFGLQDQLNLSKHLENVKAAQQELEKQAEQSSLSTAQAERLKTMTSLANRTAAILEQGKQSRRVNENQWSVIQQAVQLSQEIIKDKQATQVSEVKDRVEIGVSASAAEASPSLPKKTASKVCSVSSVAAAAGAGAPPNDPKKGGNGDPSNPNKSEPRSRWTVFKDNLSHYFTHGGVMLDLAVGAVFGGIMAIGTPVAVVTIPLAYSVIAALRTLALASLVMRDPNGDYMNQRYASWNNS